MNEKSSVSELLEKVFLLGVGAASLTKEKVTELVDELIKRGQLTQEQGNQLMDIAAVRAREETASVKESVSEAYQDTLKALGIAANDHVEELERRIAVLEAKVYGKPARVEEPDTGFRITPTEEEEPT